VTCHGPNLIDGQFGPPLTGTSFEQRWAGRSLSEFFTYLRATMPPGLTGQIEPAGYLDLIAFLLEKNGVTAADLPLAATLATLDNMVMPGVPSSEQDRLRLWSPGGPLSAGVVLPEWTVPPGPAATITPVTQAMLESPPPGDWLSWRRTYDDLGFSPLTQITRDNVSGLQLAWSLSLPPGPNAATPLVHDGVIFVHAYGDHLQALDAATGDELWHYGRLLGEGHRPGVKRNMALLGNLIYMATSDAHVIALDIKTGRVVWDQPVADTKIRMSLSGGPLAADGVIMQGIQGGGKGGAYIVGLDAASGRELWRFHTIARPGQPGGDSWNGMPVEERSGGSVWTTGSYDPVLGLAYFGPAPTYNTLPLRDPINKPGITNTALYTNATIALRPRTGELAWYFQHLANDQWDMDWAFERHILELPVDGSVTKAIVTGGKEAVFDILDAATGKYIGSFDLGLQNLITAIDRETGVKTIDPALIPYGDKTLTICPHGGGAKNWIPGSIDPQTRILYEPLVESCADLVPMEKGQLGLTSGVRYTIRPPLKSDGLYGRIQAVRLDTHATVWMQRQRAPQTSGVLATAGGVVFAGALDRWFSAYDAATGRILWRSRLGDVPSSAPISYTADGRQFIAVITGYGSGHSVTFARLTPEIDLPQASSSSIMVFTLPWIKGSE
jgi:alcohol dehydrogenase (cytochrome c)